MRFTDSLSAYRDPAVVDHYDRVDDLQDAEKQLFDRYVSKGMSILDIGVGAGRTTRHLAPLASRYVGIDMSETMIERCRRKFPGLAFRVADASQLPMFEDGSFDLIVFSFNGLGTLPRDPLRNASLSECARLLSSEGVLIFSLHNSAFLVTRPILEGVGFVRGAWRVAYAAWKTLENLPHRIFSKAYWTGAGYVIDPALHGGLRVHVSSPARTALELEQHGLAIDQCLPAPRVDTAVSAMTPWFYYAAKRRAADPNP